MADHVSFPQATSILRALPQEGDVVDKAAQSVTRADGTVISDLVAYRDARQTVSCWQLTAEELVEVMQTGQVFLCVLGDQHPPVAILGHNPWGLPELEDPTDSS